MAHYEHPRDDERHFRRDQPRRPEGYDRRADYDARGPYASSDRPAPQHHDRNRHAGPYPSRADDFDRYEDRSGRPQPNRYYSDLGSDQDRRGGYSAGFSGPGGAEYDDYGYGRNAPEARYSTDNGPLPRLHDAPGYGAPYADYDGFNSGHYRRTDGRNDFRGQDESGYGRSPEAPRRRDHDAGLRDRTYRHEAPTGYGAVYGSYDPSLYGPLTDYDHDDYGYGGHGTGRRDEDDRSGYRRR